VKQYAAVQQSQQHNYLRKEINFVKEKLNAACLILEGERHSKKTYQGTVHYVASQLFTTNKLLGITSINTTSQNHTLRQLHPLTKHVLLLCALFRNHYPLSDLRNTTYSRRPTVMQMVREKSPNVLGFSTSVYTYNWDC